jgi:hypothetical protein
MKITETEIIDLTEENVDERKVELADIIVSRFEPLIKDVYTKKEEIISNTDSKLETNKQKILKEKNEIKVLLNEYERQKKLKKVLDTVSKVDPVKLDYNRTLKNDIVVFLRILEKLSVEKMFSYLQDVIKISNKTVKKS